MWVRGRESQSSRKKLTGRPSENEDGDDVLLKTTSHSAYKETRVIERWYSFQLGGVGGRGATQCSGTAAGPFKNSQQLREGVVKGTATLTQPQPRGKVAHTKTAGALPVPRFLLLHKQKCEIRALTANHAQMRAPHMVCGVCSPARKPPQKPHNNQWPPSVRAAPNNTTGPRAHSPKPQAPPAPCT